MPAELDISNVQGFEKLGKAFRDAGKEGKKLRRELGKEMNKATNPLRMDAKRNAKATLPKKGGLGRLVASRPMRTSTLVSGMGAGVRIIAKGQGRVKNLKSMDEQGIVTHPVYSRASRAHSSGSGRKTAWVKQRVKPGWFSEPMKRGGHKVRAGAVKAVDMIVRKLNSL